MAKRYYIKVGFHEREHDKYLKLQHNLRFAEFVKEAFNEKIEAVKKHRAELSYEDRKSLLLN